MSLKEITRDLHRTAETTRFARLLLSGRITREDYANYLYQWLLIYDAIEWGNRIEGNLQSLPGLERKHAIQRDFYEIAGVDHDYRWLPSTLAYHDDLLALIRDSDRRPRIKAHLYCRHMGDLYGGQVIKARVAHVSRGRFYDFDHPDALKTAIRGMLTDDLGDEARHAFQRSIDILEALAHERP